MALSTSSLSSVEEVSSEENTAMPYSRSRHTHPAADSDVPSHESPDDPPTQDQNGDPLTLQTSPSPPKDTAPKPRASQQVSANQRSQSKFGEVRRKTKHRIIEKRRRSKMNELFAIIREMNPDSRGHEGMQKIEILEAGIQYTRYLEQRVADLEASSRSYVLSPPESVNLTTYSHSECAYASYKSSTLASPSSSSPALSPKEQIHVPTILSSPTSDRQTISNLQQRQAANCGLTGAYETRTENRMQLDEGVGRRNGATRGFRIQELLNT